MRPRPGERRDPLPRSRKPALISKTRPRGGFFRGPSGARRTVLGRGRPRPSGGFPSRLAAPAARLRMSGAPTCSRPCSDRPGTACLRASTPCTADARSSEHGRGRVKKVEGDPRCSGCPRPPTTCRSRWRSTAASKRGRAVSRPASRARTLRCSARWPDAFEESVGASRFVFAPERDGDALRWVTREARLFGVPLPLRWFDGLSARCSDLPVRHRRAAAVGRRAGRLRRFAGIPRRRLIEERGHGGVPGPRSYRSVSGGDTDGACRRSGHGSGSKPSENSGSNRSLTTPKRFLSCSDGCDRPPSRRPPLPIASV